jgi:hypothetical protein
MPTTRTGIHAPTANFVCSGHFPTRVKRRSCRLTARIVFHSTASAPRRSICDGFDLLQAVGPVAFLAETG